MNLFSSKISSKNIALERLKPILSHDRADISGEILDLIKFEIFQVINKYIEIDVSGFKMSLTQRKVDEGNYSMLIANIPIKKV